MRSILSPGELDWISVDGEKVGCNGHVRNKTFVREYITNTRHVFITGIARVNTLKKVNRSIDIISETLLKAFHLASPISVTT